jgi:beta-lactamase class A
MHKLRLALITAITSCLLLPALGQTDESQQWTRALADEISEIDARMPGRIGVYIKHLGDGGEVRHRTDRDWYIASTIKIPLALALLQKVEQGELSMQQELELAESDFVDGSGELLWREPGEQFTVFELMERSVRDSDSTATDMLIRLLGEESFNKQVRNAMVAEGFGPITTILQVRQDAYSEFHPDARKLTNLDFIDLRNEDDLEARCGRVLEMLSVEPREGPSGSCADAFERYYARGINSANLEAFGLLLERFWKRELVNEEHTEMLLKIMLSVTTGDKRIKAGLPESVQFAHKTGTQIARSCNVGILNPQLEQSTVIVLACAEGYANLGQAERAYQELGQAIANAGLAR